MKTLQKIAVGSPLAGGILSATLVLMCALSHAARAEEPPTSSHAGGDLGEIGAKLSNPVGDLWALYTEFDLSFSDGDLNQGDAKVGAKMLFEPILPFPLYGHGEHAWKLVTRPIIPVLFSSPVPKGFDDFSSIGGLGDIQLPMLVSPPAGNWLLGLGPTWLLPTATRQEFGRGQWGVGPALVVGYKTKDWIGGVFPQYTWGLGDSGRDPNASYGSMLYWYYYNLPGGWQVGSSETVSYDNNASSGNQWNVPVNLTVTKTIKVGKVPVKLQLGVSYSPVSQDAFGQEAVVKLNIIPVIPSLVKNPIFGG